MSTAKVPAASLLLDENLYPRHKVDATHVAHIRSALRAGEDLPPVVADRKSKKVTDGFHRITGHLKEFGDDAEIKVEWREYDGEAEMLLDAIHMNSGHGHNLSRYDRVRCIQLAEEYRITPEQVAAALRSRPDEVQKLRATRTAKDKHGMVPIKQGLGHLAGRRITKRQAAGIGSFGGKHQMWFVNQLIHLIEHDLLDTENEGLMERLAQLAGLLETIDVMTAA